MRVGMSVRDFLAQDEEKQTHHGLQPRRAVSHHKPTGLDARLDHGVMLIIVRHADVLKLGARNQDVTSDIGRSCGSIT